MIYCLSCMHPHFGINCSNFSVKKFLNSEYSSCIQFYNHKYTLRAIFTGTPLRCMQ